MRGDRLSLRSSSTKHLFTDASHVSQFGIGAWASMLVDGCDSFVRSDLFHEFPPCATSAEAIAAQLALGEFLRIGYISCGDTVIIHCDNDGVCSYLNRETLKARPKLPHFRSALDEINALAKLYELKICARWVAGHQGLRTNEWRGLINARVDAIARAITRDEKNRLKEAERIEAE